MTYDLKSVRLPRLGTAALRVFAALIENPVTGPALVSKLRHDAGIQRVKHSTAEDVPTYLPLLDADDRAVPPFNPAAAPHAPGFQFSGIGDFASAYREGRTSPEQIGERFLAQQARSESDRPG